MTTNDPGEGPTYEGVIPRHKRGIRKADPAFVDSMGRTRPNPSYVLLVTPQHVGNGKLRTVSLWKKRGWNQWVDELADHCGIDRAQIIEVAVRRLAEAEDFPVPTPAMPAPKRMAGRAW